ncbi:MAG: LolA family protein [Pyrinomonadaceae bacterium]
MKRISYLFLHLSLLGAITLGLAVSVAITPKPARAQGPQLISSIVNRMERNRRDLRSLRASISMEKFNSQLGDKDVYNGVVLYMPGKGRNLYVRVDWNKPQQETLALADGEYVLYRPRIGQALYGNANSNQNKINNALGFGFNVTPKQLSTSFEQPQYMGEETLYGGIKTTHIKLQPRGSAGYKYVEMWVDMDGMPVQTKWVEKNDDSTTVHLTAVERNAHVTVEDFHLKLDSNVKKVRA